MPLVNGPERSDFMIEIWKGMEWSSRNSKNGKKNSLISLCPKQSNTDIYSSLINKTSQQKYLLYFSEKIILISISLEDNILALIIFMGLNFINIIVIY